eukprot:jgi/Galph1/3393/GphlegSOOS_G2030.1
MATESDGDKIYERQNEENSGAVFGGLSVNIPSYKSTKRIRATMASNLNENDDLQYIAPISSHNRGFLSPFDQTGEFLSNFELPFLDIFQSMPSSSGSEKRSTPPVISSPTDNVKELLEKGFDPTGSNTTDDQESVLILHQTKEEPMFGTQAESEDGRRLDQSSAGSFSSHIPEHQEDDEEKRKRELRVQRNRESAMRSRIRKNNYIAELERRVEALTAEKMRLEGSLLQLWMENEMLKRGGSGNVAQHFLSETFGNVLGNPFLLSSFLQKVDPVLSSSVPVTNSSSSQVPNNMVNPNDWSPTKFQTRVQNRDSTLEASTSSLDRHVRKGRKKCHRV